MKKETVKKVFETYGRKCVLCGASHVQLHHNLIFGGRQSDFYKTILPVCPPCHQEANKVAVRERLNYVMLQTFTGKEMKKYSKVDNLEAKFNYLYDKYRQI